MMSSLLGLVLLVLDILAILRLFESKVSSGLKVLWTLLILFFPVIGLIIWWFAGPGKKS